MTPLAVLPGLAALGKLLLHPPLCLAELRRDRLVEQLHYLIEHIGGGLCQNRQQNRVTALRVPAFEV